MTAEMDLICFEETRHVLAATTRSQTGGNDPGAADYVGDGLLIRDPQRGARLLSIDADLLRVTTVDRRDDVLLTAIFFELAEGLPELLEEAAIGNPVALDGSDATITIPAAAAALAPVDCVLFLRAQSGGDVSAQRLRVEQGDATASAAAPALSGEHGYVLLVPGYRVQAGLTEVP